MLADGEHYPPVVVAGIDYLRTLGWNIVGVVLVGGTEKLRGTPDYGAPLVHADSQSPRGVYDAIGLGIEEWQPAWTIDVSDEPVMTFEQRTATISQVTSRGISWAGPDAQFIAPILKKYDTPTLGIIGTGKRIGKTAISGYVARLADSIVEGEVVVLAMGRGGPEVPEIIQKSGGAITVETLLEISRSGKHAASDYLEDAVLTGCTTVGCRRGGGGFLGAPVVSNVPEGMSTIVEMKPALTIVEGSGSCVPPVSCDHTILLGSTARPDDLLQGFGLYRRSLADLILIVGDDREVAIDMIESLRITDRGTSPTSENSTSPATPAIAVSLRPVVTEEITGARVAFFTTAPSFTEPLYRELADSRGATCVAVSHNLSRRDQLVADFDAAIATGIDTVAVEIKAAAIDTIAERAQAAGLRIVLLDNHPVPHDSAIDLTSELHGHITSADFRKSLRSHPPV